MRGQLVDGDQAGLARLEEAFDYVIIGTGASGATAARVLVDSGASVALVEEGPALQPRDFGTTAWPALRHLYRDTGAQVARGGGALMRVVQGSCLGGSTVVNSGIAWRMPESVWHTWDHDYGLGQAIPYAALERTWDLLDRELSVQPTEPAIRGENNRLLELGASRLQVKAGPTNRYVRGCRGSARCQLGCASGAKQSMLVTYLPYAREKGAAVLTSARADRILVDHGRAVGVAGRFRARTAPNGQARRFVLRARKAVLVAASAVQTPGLLASSGVRSPHVGRHFQAHPGGVLLGVFDREVNSWSGATQGFNVDHHLEDLRCKIETLALPPEVLLAQMPGVGRRWMDQIANARHVASWAVVLRTHAEGTVRERPFFGGQDVRFSLEPRDVDNLRRGLRFAAELLFAAGARSVIPGVYGLPECLTQVADAARLESGPSDPAAYSLTMSHLFGTARMSVRPEDGVVGTDFAVHGLKGLYVVDSSVFPTNLGVNPQHTIMAVAMLAAEHIAENAP